MRRGFASAVFVLLAGCSAVVVDLRRPVKGPVPEVGYIDPGGGQVRYALRGASFLVSQRRAHALRLARRHCAAFLPPQKKSPAIRIAKEWTQEDSETPYNAEELDVSLKNDLEHYKVEPYRHLEFQCVVTP